MEDLDIPANLVEFADVLERLRVLNYMVGQEILPADYIAVINSFSNAWFWLADKFFISTTPKLHVIIDHLNDYYMETKLSLVKTADHLIEHMHHYTHKRMVTSNYYVKDVMNFKHRKQLYNAITHINLFNCV